MVKRAKAGIRVSIWVDHGGAENMLTWLYWRSLAQAKIFSNDLWRRPCMDSTLELKRKSGYQSASEMLQLLKDQGTHSLNIDYTHLWWNNRYCTKSQGSRHAKLIHYNDNVNTMCSLSLNNTRSYLTLMWRVKHTTIVASNFQVFSPVCICKLW